MVVPASVSVTDWPAPSTVAELLRPSFCATVIERPVLAAIVSVVVPSAIPPLAKAMSDVAVTSRISKFDTFAAPRVPPTRNTSPVPPPPSRLPDAARAPTITASEPSLPTTDCPTADNSTRADAPIVTNVICVSSLTKAVEPPVRTRFSTLVIVASTLRSTAEVIWSVIVMVSVPSPPSTEVSSDSLAIVTYWISSSP